MGKAWAAPLAFLYGIGIWVRHKMFDWGWLRSRKFDIPVVCVGNLTVGGTGKTPVTEMLVANFSKRYNVAVLSRGYKRRTKGYLEVEKNSRFLDTGDEPKQIKLKFPDVVVAVCEKRTEGIDRIRENHPEINLIILDDGFQHRYVQTWADIVLMDYNRPIYRDHLLPWGNLRDLKSQLHRASFVIVTKCPPDMTPIDRRIVRKSLGLYPYQNLYFATTETGRVRPLFPQDGMPELRPGSDVIAMSGIGNPESFRRVLARKYNVVDELVYPDHHPYRRRDLAAMAELLEQTGGNAYIVTTEKDMVKLAGSKKIPRELRERLYYMPVKISLYEDSEKDFINKLSYDVRTNPEDRLLRS